MVLEATGGLQIPVTAALAQAGIPVTVVNPRQVRDFARATGKLAKTDTLVAIVACMRKLLTILNAMVKHGELWKTTDLAQEGI